MREGEGPPSAAMASTSRASRVGVAGAPPPGALVLPSVAEAAARPSAHARDKPTVSLLAGTLRLLRDMAMRARREAEAARARHEPSGDTGAHDTNLFATYRGKTLHLPSRILEAATYVRTHGAEASAEDAASRGITAGCLSSVALSLLGDLDDVLLTSKLHEAFLAAIKIQDYRSRLYVLRLLLERVPSDRLAATRHLVEVLAVMRSDAAKAAKSAADGEENAADARPPPSTYDTVLRTLVPKLFRRKGEPKPDPDAAAAAAAAAAVNETVSNQRMTRAEKYLSSDIVAVRPERWPPVPPDPDWLLPDWDRVANGRAGQRNPAAISAERLFAGCEHLAQRTVLGVGLQPIVSEVAAVGGQKVATVPTISEGIPPRGQVRGMQSAQEEHSEQDVPGKR